MTGKGDRKISSLRDLPRDIAPPRDLWQGIEAQIAADRRAVSEAPAAPLTPKRRDARLRLLAAAAMVATLAVGIWIGRATLPGAGVGTGTGVVADGGARGGAGSGGTVADVGTRGGKTAAGETTAGGSGGVGGQVAGGAALGGEPGAFHAAYVMDSKYLQQRAKLVKGLEARLMALPPESRAKVLASLQTISDSKRDLEEALGKDPSNALLQELLVNTYQDEMRVLTAVHEAGSAGEGI